MYRRNTVCCVVVKMLFLSIASRFHCWFPSLSDKSLDLPRPEMVCWRARSCLEVYRSARPGTGSETPYKAVRKSIHDLSCRIGCDRGRFPVNILICDSVVYSLLAVSVILSPCHSVGTCLCLRCTLQTVGAYWVVLWLMFQILEDYFKKAYFNPLKIRK